MQSLYGTFGGSHGSGKYLHGLWRVKEPHGACHWFFFHAPNLSNRIKSFLIPVYCGFACLFWTVEDNKDRSGDIPEGQRIDVEVAVRFKKKTPKKDICARHENIRRKKEIFKKKYAMQLA